MTEQRVFFALRPARAAREALLNLPGDAGIGTGRLQHVDDVHMTLVFVGSLDEARLNRLRASAAGISGVAVRLEMDRLEYWPRPRIACASVSHPPAALLDLHRHLVGVLREADFSMESRAYRPHVTLMRKSSPFDDRPLAETIRWRADRFLLYASAMDGRLPRYRPIQEFSLG